MGMATLFLLEICMRVLPPILPEPTKSLLEEAARIPLSNTRTIHGTQIELPPAQPADVAVIGDSFPFGTYVKKAATFPALLEKKAGRRVVNLGIGSQSPPQYNRMVEVSARYQPKEVLYCLFANDFLNGTFPESLLTLSPERAFKSLPEDQELFKEQISTRDRMLTLRKQATNYLLSLQLVKLFDQPAQQNNLEKVAWKDRAGYFAFINRSYWDSLLSFENQNVVRDLPGLIQLVNAAAVYCQGMGARFTVVMIPSKEMVYEAVVPVEVQSRIYSDAHYKTYQMLADTLKKMEIASLDLTPDLRSAASGGKKLYFSIDGHFNELGHEVAAEILANYLQSEKGSENAIFPE